LNRYASAAQVVALIALAGAASAASPRYWLHDTADEFLAGDVEGLSVDAGGSLRLAPDLKTLAELEAPYVWDVAVSGDDAYVGTGDDGWVLRVRGDRVEQFFQCAAYEVLSVETGPDGAVYAGTAPEGLIYRIEKDGTGRILFDAAEPYVWDLALGPDKMLYAAVGPDGKVYRVDPKTGRSEAFFETDDHHVVCLAFEADGALLLGTEGRGLVVLVTPDRAVRVLHDCPLGEVAAVLAGDDGIVWAAAAAAAGVREVGRRECSVVAVGDGR
jgi:outer membrane protein assembly factor BamB